MTTIEEGINFILSHFQEPIFPRRIFTPIQKQIKIENTDEILKYFKESKLYDCRISAFPFLENYILNYMVHNHLIFCLSIWTRRNSSQDVHYI